MTQLYTIKDAHSHNGFYYGECSDWLVAAVQTRDSDVLVRANFIATIRELKSHGLEWERETSSHWAVGYVEYLITPDTPDAKSVLTDIAARLENYPVLDEELWSEMEYTEAIEYWESMSLWERVQWCRDDGESIFAARSDGHDLYDRAPKVWESLTRG